MTIQYSFSNQADIMEMEDNLMKVGKLYLKDYFQQLGNDECNAYVDCYLIDKVPEMGNRQKIYPCLVICPGGAYCGISGREGEPIAMQFLSEGYCVFVLHYSVQPHAFPQQLLEVAAVMEIIQMHSEEWNCDVNNTTIMGFSAGGHLAAQYSNRYDCSEVRTLFPTSKGVKKVILGYPVITSERAYAHPETLCNFVGHQLTSLDDKGCSCELLVTEKTPPTFLWHTAEDELVAVENSLLYSLALSKYKVPYELHIFPYGPHGMATADNSTCFDLERKTSHCYQWIEQCKKWLRLFE